MRKIFFILALSLLSVCGAKAQCSNYTLTPNVGFYIPNVGATAGWGNCINADITTLDTLLGGAAFLAAANTTPSIAGNTNFITQNTGGVTITNFTGGYNGQKLTILCGASDSYTQIAATVNIYLQAPFSCASGAYAIISFVRISNVWWETNRSIPAANYALTSSGNFSNTQTNTYLTASLNGCNIASEFQANQGNNTTVAISGCVSIPSGATVYNSSAVSGFTTNSNANSSASMFGTGGYFQSRCLAAGTKCVGDYVIASDLSGIGSTTIQGAVVALSIAGSPSAVQGLQVSGVLNGTMPSSLAIDVSKTGTNQWTGAFQSDSSAATYGLILGTITGAASSNSQYIQLLNSDASNIQHSNLLYADSGGDIVLSPASNVILGGSTYLSPGKVFLSGQTPISQSGLIRLAYNEGICWRNAGNSADNCMTSPPATATSVNYGRLVGGVCTTPSGTSGGTCQSSVPLNFSEPDTNYGASCTGVGPTGYPLILGMFKGVSSITITISNGTGNMTQASTFTEIDCTVVGT